MNKFEDIREVRKRFYDGEGLLRRQLAFAYEKLFDGSLYGDDGELQLQLQDPFILIDFVRDSAEEINIKISDVNLYRYAKANNVLNSVIEDKE